MFACSFLVIAPPPYLLFSYYSPNVNAAIFLSLSQYPSRELDDFWLCQRGICSAYVSSILRAGVILAVMLRIFGGAYILTTGW